MENSPGFNFALIKEYGGGIVGININSSSHFETSLCEWPGNGKSSYEGT